MRQCCRRLALFHTISFISQAKFAPEKALKHIEDGITWKAEPLAFLQKIHGFLKKGDTITLAVNTAVSNPDPDATVKLSAAADADDTVKMDSTGRLAAVAAPSARIVTDLSGSLPSLPLDSNDAAKAAGGIKKLSGLGKGECQCWQQHLREEWGVIHVTQCWAAAHEGSNQKSKRRWHRRKRVSTCSTKRPKKQQQQQQQQQCWKKKDKSTSSGWTRRWLLLQLKRRDSSLRKKKKLLLLQQLQLWWLKNGGWRLQKSKLLQQQLQRLPQPLSPPQAPASQAKNLQHPS
jgi:hypothetical protein